ncbi:MAG: hypothetical protein SV375_10060, partial [Thermodesulfobacteriota bacterium]|nr:hypothetical protein [Thermodesulfobacteriota bacterium]
EKLIRKVVDVFFSFFGTSESADVKAFAQKQVNFIREGKVGPELGKKLQDIFRSFEEDSLENIGDRFAQVFDPLLQILVFNWIETYKKPVMTTSFMGRPPVLTDMGHYAYPFAEQATFVLAKLLEYKKYLNREKKNNKEIDIEGRLS